MLLYAWRMDNVNSAERLPYRRLQALETRRRIARAARVVFSASGYASASIESVAGEAGVAVRTVYSIFGTKKAILGVICDEWLAEAGVAPLFGEAMAETDPTRRLGLVARAARVQWESGRDVRPMLEAGAASDAEVRTMLDGWKGERARVLRESLEGIFGDLRPGLTLERAAAVLRGLTAAEVFTELTEGEGWSGDEYQTWLAALLVEVLLPRGAAGIS